MNACDAVQELLAAHLLTALGESEETLVSEHLRSCERCQVAREETQFAVDQIEAPPVKAPPLVWNKIRTRIEREAAGDPVRDTDPSPVISLTCSFCRGGMTRQGSVYCASCLAPHHPECFQEHGRCSVMGCAETKVVRPSELPPLVLHQGGRPMPPRRRRWLQGGLGLLVLAGAGVAAFGPLQEAEQPSILRPKWELQPTRLAYRLEVREATLLEVVQAIRALPEQPVIQLPEALSNLLVRRADFEGLHWTVALSRLLESFDLRLVQEKRSPTGSVSWAIIPPRGYDVEDYPRAQQDQLEVDRTQVVSLDPNQSPAEVHTGWEQRLHVAPAPSPYFALSEGRQLMVFRSKELLGVQTLEAPARDAKWSADGSRLAYVSGQGGIGQLGLFHASKDHLTHTVVREFPGLEEGSQLSWCGDGATLLLRTNDVIRTVSTLIGGQAITLSRPSPAGFKRFELLAMGDEAFLVLYPDGVEGWDLQRAKPLYPRVPLPVGYTIGEPVHDGDRWLAIVTTQSSAVLFDAQRGILGRSPLQQRTSDKGAWQVELDRAGRLLAWLDDGELLLRHLDPKRSGDAEYDKAGPLDEDVRGFRWGSDGALATWTEDAIFVERWQTTPERIVTLDGTVQDVRWLAAPDEEEPQLSPAPTGQLVVTNRTLAKRQAKVRLEPED